jgi:hypothetical protein
LFGDGLLFVRPNWQRFTVHLMQSETLWREEGNQKLVSQSKQKRRRSFTVGGDTKIET